MLPPAAYVADPSPRYSSTEFNCTALSIDWETAYARQYDIKVSKDPSGGFATIFSEEDGSTPGVQPVRDTHVLHKVLIPPAKQKVGRYVRLVLLQSGTKWGISLWRFDIYGCCPGPCMAQA